MNSVFRGLLLKTAKTVICLKPRLLLTNSALYLFLLGFCPSVLHLCYRQRRYQPHSQYDFTPVLHADDPNLKRLPRCKGLSALKTPWLTIYLSSSFIPLSSLIWTSTSKIMGTQQTGNVSVQTPTTSQASFISFVAHMWQL